MLGDNVYGDSEREDLLELREAYDLQRQNFDSFNFDFPFEAIWDDRVSYTHLTLPTICSV